MAKRTIGIDIGPNMVRAVQLVHSRRGVHIERVASCAVGGTSPRDEAGHALSTALLSLIKDGGFKSGAEVAVNVPCDAVYFQTLETDLTNLDHVQQVLKFELEEDFPFPMDELVMDVCGVRRLRGDAQSILVAAVGRNTLRERLRVLADAGIACGVMDADVCALHAVIRETHSHLANAPIMMAYLREAHVLLAIAEQGHLVTARSFALRPAVEGEWAEADSIGDLAAALARETELTWRDSFGTAIPPATPLVVGGDAELTHDVSERLREELPCDVTTISSFGAMTVSEDVETPPSFALAAGLALRAGGGTTPGMNFLAADTLKSDRVMETKRALIISGVALGAIAVAWFSGLFLQWKALERDYQGIRAETRRIFNETVPEEKKIVHELQQLDEKLGALRREYDTFASVTARGATPLRIMGLISAAIPKRINVKISELTIVGRSVRLTGTTSSFRSVDSLKARLEAVAEFASVQIQPTEVDHKSGTVRFTLLISIAMM